MARGLLILVTGQPGTGKTTLARRLASDLDLPVICRDDLKEIMFDGLGWRDRAWSQQLGRTSFQLLRYCIDRHLTAGGPFIAEANFDPLVARAELGPLVTRSQAATLEIHCRAEPTTLFERFVARDASGERHPGHIDRAGYADLRQRLAQTISQPVALGGPVVELDTTDLAAIDYPALATITRHSIAAMHPTRPAGG